MTELHELHQLSLDVLKQDYDYLRDRRRELSNRIEKLDDQLLALKIVIQAKEDQDHADYKFQDEA